VDVPTDALVSTPKGGKRPIAVTFVGLLALGAGAYYLIESGVRIANGGSTGRIGGGVFDIALGIVALAIGRGALRSATWAWAALMTWSTIGLTNELLRHFFYGSENYVSLAVDAAIVLALTPLDIQVAFGVRQRPAAGVGFDRGPGDGIG
jgi:hypothetical protein